MISNSWLSPADLSGGASLGVGDVVRTGVNQHPQYRVIAVTGDKAWIRDTQHGSDHVLPIDQRRTSEGGGL